MDRSLPRTETSAPFFDLQINGGEGVSFNSANLTVEEVGRVTALCRLHGVTGFCPTVVTSAYDATVHALATIRKARETAAAARRTIAAVHLEGPYISPEDGARGAHPGADVRPPDWDEFRRFQDAADGLIRLVTLAPELSGALEFIERLTAHGVVVAVGHTAADEETVRDATSAGAKLSTHLGNGCTAVLPRHDNVIWHQLAEDRLWASLIADGHHLPPAVLRSVLRVKSSSRAILTCDAGSLAGLPPGRYRDWDQDLEVRPEGRILVAGTPYPGRLGVVYRPLRRPGGERRRRQLGRGDRHGRRRPRDLLGLPAVEWTEGGQAEAVLFDWEPGGPLTVRQVVGGPPP